jgi:chemotaxis signal transduction protein
MTLERGPERFDWEGAKKRILAAAEAESRSLEDVFARRAAELARAFETNVELGTPHLVFDASGERFAVAQSEVSVVLQADALHPVPFARSVVDRMLLVSGKLVSVYDLGLRAGGPRVSGLSVIVLASSERVGLRADTVRGIVLIDRSTLIRPLEGGSRLDPILHGTTTEQIRVLSVPQLLSDGSR